MQNLSSAGNYRRKMALHCTKCNKDIINRELLTCVTCQKSFHVICTTNVSIKRFYLMTPENKTNWKCTSCIVETHNTDHDYTPIASPYQSPSTPSTCSNITVRNKHKINIPTSNSFESLSENDEYEYESSTSVCDLNRSCPEILTSDRYRLEELTKKIRLLQEKLEIAEQEIENNCHENYTLKNKILAQEKTIENLKMICKSSGKKSSCLSTTKKTRKSLTRTHLNFSVSKDEANQSIVQTDQLNELDTYSKVDDTGTYDSQNNHLHAENLLKTDEALSSPSEENNKPGIRNKIVIIGDEQVSGLSAALLKSRSGKWNDIYDPSAFIMENASSTELMDYCIKTYSDKKLTEEDIVILSIGSHNKNPEILHSDLCTILYLFRNTQIYIMPVNFNPYLNEQILNYYIKLWTKHFNNCTVIESKYFRRRFDYVFYVCNKINLYIDSNRYNSQFLTLTNLIPLLKAQGRLGTASNSINMQNIEVLSDGKCLNSKTYDNAHNSLPKKGTIPYYFQVQKSEGIQSEIVSTNLFRI